MKNNYEILSPAGNFESLVSGINAGCNAIYLGGEKFSARSKAINFSNEDLIKAVNYAHLRKAKIYVTINILIDDSEMEDALKFAKFLYEIGVDALIVQDIGFAINARKLFKNMEIHASTQMAINNLYGAKFVESLGFERVVLARETELFEINRIKKNTSLDIEAFIHGALCVCFSGECLMSSMIGGRSGNRGDCAQPCRKKYEIYDLNKEKIAESANFLSTKDLNTLDNVEDLIDRGVYSLKIEGRMKRPEYVSQIVSTYKKSIESTLDEIDYENTTQIFNRGFTKGLFYGDFGRDFISYDRPDNRGILVGEVLSKNRNTYILSFKKDVSEKDGLEFRTNNGYFGTRANFNIKAGKIVKFETNKDIKVNSQIYKTSSDALLNSLREDINEEKKFHDISIHGEFLLGKYPKLEIKLGDYSVETYGESIVEEAKKAPLTEEKIINNLTKLGNTVYNACDINLKLDENIFMPVSLLNSLRRDAIEKLDAYLLKIDREEIDFNKNDFKVKRDIEDKDAKVSVEINNLEDLKDININSVDNIYMDMRNINDSIVDYIKENNVKLTVVFPKYQTSIELEESIYKLDSFIDYVDGVCLNNLAQVEIFKDEDIKKIADIGLNIFNSYTANEFIKMGFEKLILSPELNIKQIRNIAKNFADKIEIVSHGLIPVMTMPHCPMSIVKNCKDSSNCDMCKFAKGFFVRDTMDVDFLVERRDGISEIYNSYPIMLIDKIEEFKKIGVSSYKLNLRGDIEKTIDIYSKALKGYEYSDGKTRDLLIEKFGHITYGHYNRGIINE